MSTPRQFYNWEDDAPMEGGSKSVEEVLADLERVARQHMEAREAEDGAHRTPAGAAESGSTSNCRDRLSLLVWGVGFFAGALFVSCAVYGAYRLIFG